MELSINFTFSCCAQTHRLCVPPDPANTHFFGLSSANFEEPIFWAGSLDWKPRKTLLQVSQDESFLNINSFSLVWYMEIQSFPGIARLTASERMNTRTVLTVSTSRVFPDLGFDEAIIPLSASSSLRCELVCDFEFVLYLPQNPPSLYYSENLIFSLLAALSNRSFSCIISLESSRCVVSCMPSF